MTGVQTCALPISDSAKKQRFFVESRLSNVELVGVNGVKRGKSHQNLTAAQAAIQN